MDMNTYAVVILALSGVVVVIGFLTRHQYAKTSGRPYDPTINRMNLGALFIGIAAAGYIVTIVLMVLGLLIIAAIIGGLSLLLSAIGFAVHPVKKRQQQADQDQFDAAA